MMNREEKAFLSVPFVTKKPFGAADDKVKAAGTELRSEFRCLDVTWLEMRAHLKFNVTGTLGSGGLGGPRRSSPRRQPGRSGGSSALILNKHPTVRVVPLRELRAGVQHTRPPDS